MPDLLLEIGVEEMPAPHLEPAESYIRTSFSQMMESARLEYSSLQVSSTPRRFFLLARQVQEHQAETRVTKTGPAISISYDAEGNLLPAAVGFLKKNNAQAGDLYIEKTERGEFIALSYVQPGQAAVKIIARWITELIPQIPFARKMLWNHSRLSFSRPLRWLCALWGEEIIPLKIAGIASGRISYGNRYLGLERQITIPSPERYLELLRQQAVLADREERRNQITRQLAQVLSGSGFRVLEDERLTATVCDLVEYPTAVAAEFEERYLDLPEKIITSTISQNQKYFAVLDSRGRLSNKFVFISNGDAGCSDIIRRGNEKVVKARLSDALWYFAEDTKQPLDSFLPRLREVVFQSALGSMADKTGRIQKLVSRISTALGLEKEQADRAQRTAELCKADLVTTMLGEKEFTKLQGYIGKQYALASGENEEVAEGIQEHYMPRGTADGLPQTLCGAVVAVADKLDSVCGIIGIGLLPTGSADPFALRRAANGVVQIILDREWELDLGALLSFALEQIKLQAPVAAKAEENILSFFLQRVVWMLKQLKIDYDVVDSVLHLRLASLPDLKRQALALQGFRTREDFLRLVIGFKRVSNIISGEGDFEEVAPALFAEQQEGELYSRLLQLRAAIDKVLENNDYSAAITLLVEYGAHIDSFFDHVLVNCEDGQLRRNRHALLHLVKQEFLRVADISRIVIESEEE